MEQREGIEPVREALNAILRPPINVVRTWDGWKSELKDGPRSLLVIICHTAEKRSSSGPVVQFEIGGKTAKEWLAVNRGEASLCRRNLEADTLADRVADRMQHGAPAGAIPGPCGEVPTRRRSGRALHDVDGARPPRGQGDRGRDRTTGSRCNAETTTVTLTDLDASLSYGEQRSEATRRRRMPPCGVALQPGRVTLITPSPSSSHTGGFIWSRFSVRRRRVSWALMLSL